MKLTSEHIDGVLTVHLSGDVAGRSCNCLEHFLDRHVPDAPAPLRIDFSGAAAIDRAAAEAIATLLLQRSTACTTLALVSPPPPLVAIMHRRVPACPLVIEETPPQSPV